MILVEKEAETNSSSAGLVIGDRGWGSTLSPGHFLGERGKRPGDSREWAGFRAVSVWQASLRQALQAAPTWFRRARRMFLGLPFAIGP